MTKQIEPYTSKSRDKNHENIYIIASGSSANFLNLVRELD